MESLVRGIHHVTLCAGSAQEDVDFFTRVLGQRLVKLTVLMDGSIPVYHLYYGNADADVGSIATSFPYSRRAGRAGTGQVSSAVYAVPRGSLPFWIDHLDRHRVELSGPFERFGSRYIRLRHPAGPLLEMMETGPDPRRPWTTAGVSGDVAARGFAGAVLSVQDAAGLEQFLIEGLGLRKAGADGAYRRFELPGPVAQAVDVLSEPDRAPGSWGFGAGTFHHIAFEVDDDEALSRQKAWYEELGYTDASEIKDRYYFHSMYVRSPGGILVECTSSAPGGFYQDETPEELGTKLHLPPWYEEQHEAIVSMLEPLRLPHMHDARSIARRAAPPVRRTAVPPSRTKPAFTRAR